METTLNLNPTLKREGYRPAASPRAAAPFGSEQLSMSPRQTAALLPTEFVPAGGQAVKQEVAERKQEQSRLVEEARELAAKANAYMRLADTHLEFTVSDATGRVIIAVVESDTQEVVRRIPPESLDRFADRITQMRGLLFETTG